MTTEDEYDQLARATALNWANENLPKEYTISHEHGEKMFKLCDVVAEALRTMAGRTQWSAYERIKDLTAKCERLESNFHNALEDAEKFLAQREELESKLTVAIEALEYADSGHSGWDHAVKLALKKIGGK